ncbi:hypothetical protein SAY87_013507 [Trapa incisa]|uniref:Dof zinc finger protein n=2 Tax=Trapa TaxID=22665 RepID=A0AAN7QBB5_TRANT|nr:hypothetical protein SAY86_008640 [Trapa natans]KAK4764069.1 hypothetical protein SAY87_013507 [Trapa incisa]
MEPPLRPHQDISMAAPTHTSQLEDMLAYAPKATPQKDLMKGGSNKAAVNKSSAQQQQQPQPEQPPLNCPRCDSTNTKFCYYNNYSLSQPRYFCKSCRRYWTKGGTLRNVPVGGGCRKNNKRPSSSTSSPSATSKRPHNIDPQLSAISGEANSTITPHMINSGFHSDLSFLGLRGAIGNTSASSSSPINIPSGFFEPQHHNSSFDNFHHWPSSVPKQETASGMDNDNWVLWGHPWNGSSEGIDSRRSTGLWNEIVNTAATNNWHGLLDSPLMM